VNKPVSVPLEHGDLSSITTYQAGAMQSSAHRTLQKHCDTVLKDYGISKMQWLIIGSVLDAGRNGVRITELAEQLGTTLPYLTTTINMLESKKMVTRRENHTDSRSKLVVVAPSFKRQCTEIERVLRDSLRRTIYAHIEPEDFRTYMKVLYKLSKIH
jgi:DNA-binding MarR family transcriptional regulator